MSRNDESDFQAAFAGLHRRQREQAPPFGAMRERAVRAAEVRPPVANRSFGWLPWRLAAVAVAVLIVAAWWTIPGPEPASRAGGEVASAQRVEQLLAAIEAQVELTAAVASPEYSTDILLSQNQTPPTP